MTDGNGEKKPIELEYARPVENRSFQDALTEFVKQETANGNLTPASRTRLLLQAIVTFGTIIGILLALSWYAYRFRR